MRKESRNWKLVNNPELFEFPEKEEYLVTSSLSRELIKCEDCGASIKTKEKWGAFQRSSRVRKSPLSEGFLIRATVEFYCQSCFNQ